MNTTDRRCCHGTQITFTNFVVLLFILAYSFYIYQRTRNQPEVHAGWMNTFLRCCILFITPVRCSFYHLVKCFQTFSQQKQQTRCCIHYSLALEPTYWSLTAHINMSHSSFSFICISAISISAGNILLMRGICCTAGILFSISRLLHLLRCRQMKF